MVRRKPGISDENVFELVTPFAPAGDQPAAIDSLVDGINDGASSQVLMGATGSGKTFTMANVISQIGRPTLVLSHNKTLAAQLYGEFRDFFPHNAVHYFVSYYDYYQPEAYIPTTGTYIEKDLQINEEIEKMRLSTTSSLLSGRRDVLVVASVSCLYGMGNPEAFNSQVVQIQTGQRIARQKLLHQLVQALYARTTGEFKRGNFRVKGDTVDLFPAYGDLFYRILFLDDEIERIEVWDPVAMERQGTLQELRVFPANLFVTTPDQLNRAIKHIELDLGEQVQHFYNTDRPLEGKRLQERTTFDLEMIRELGYCSGIENYSRYLTGRLTGEPPPTLFEFIPDNAIVFADESHVSVPQIGGMYKGDYRRKFTLSEHGFRLPSCMDNRPLKFEEWDAMRSQSVFVSATPSKWELEQSGGVFAEQVIRPTGLLDPMIEIRPVETQVDDLLDEVKRVAAAGYRILCTTLTKRMAEDLTEYMHEQGVRVRYMHSEIDTLERIEILRDLRLGAFDVLIGINLLREGLDIPECGLVAILDADKEGFLRSETSLIQTIGRAARNAEGRVIMYADKITGSMERAMGETDRRREKQIAYNIEHGITPETVKKNVDDILSGLYQGDVDMNRVTAQIDPALQGSNLRAILDGLRTDMRKAAENLEFEEAARLRDEVKRLEAVDLAIADDPLARQQAVAKAGEEATKARGRSTAGRPGQRGGNVKRRGR